MHISKISPPELRQYNRSSSADKLEMVQHENGPAGLRDTATGATYYVSNYDRVWRIERHRGVTRMNFFDPHQQCFVTPRQDHHIEHERFAQLNSKDSVMLAMGLAPPRNLAGQVSRGLGQRLVATLVDHLPVPSIIKNLLVHYTLQFSSSLAPRPPVPHDHALSFDVQEGVQRYDRNFSRTLPRRRPTQSWN